MYKRLKILRNKHCLSTQELSNKLNISEKLYIKYESGKRKIPVNILSKIANIYNTSIDYIIEDTNEIKPYKKANTKKYIYLKPRP